jgi:Na+/H+-dicarboxylate symporter
MATCTALTNIVGNCLAVFVIAKSENDFNQQQFDSYLALRRQQGIGESNHSHHGSQESPDN